LDFFSGSTAFRKNYLKAKMKPESTGCPRYRAVRMAGRSCLRPTPFAIGALDMQKKKGPGSSGVQSPRAEKAQKSGVRKGAGECAASDHELPGSAETRGKADQTDFPIVGIGASAGGLEAFEQFFTNMPPDTGMAFVLIQHLDPTHKSILTDLIRRYTSMNVVQIQDGRKVEPNTIFVIPPNRYIGILHGKLHLMEPTAAPGHRTPIDSFFRSLAEDRKEKGICIVLSGTGTEGTLGLRAIKGEGGMVMVQSPESAKYDGMPRSAVATELADYVVSVDKMPEQLIAYVQQVFGKGTPPTAKPVPKETGLLDKIFIILRSHTGHDFSHYKPNTIIRRIERRMAINDIANMSGYLRHLQVHPPEAQTLFRELLIGVTNFFRDPEAFEVLKEKVIPQVLENRKGDSPVRIWVPGCATGEEAYSIAISFRERMDSLKKEFRFQVFATDIDAGAIETARAGLYPKSIGVDVPTEILGRYFEHLDGSYRIKKSIRDMVVFALQNVIADPPFSKTDLISCRNLLIYLGPEVQKKVLRLFHYSLNKDGFLFLGSSETIGDGTNLFSPLDRKWKVFRRKHSGLLDGRIHEFHAAHPATPEVAPDEEGPPKILPRAGYREVVEKVILQSYGPAGVIINEKYEILYVHGRTGKYLEIISGGFSGNILGMAREGLKLELASTIRQAIAQNKEIRCERLRVKTNGDIQAINLAVKPVLEPASMRGLFLVLFEDVPSEKVRRIKRKKSAAVAEAGDSRVQELEQELKSAKEYLQTTMEGMETSNEELKSLNEELQSANEELQSTNEELETSKEELQSVNEELVTVNSELEQKINELSKTSSDMQNLLSSTEIGTIFLDTGLNIKRFTPTMAKFINLIPTDVGRSVGHIVSNMHYEGLVQDAKEVLKTLVPKETEVQTKDNRWYAMRIRPYRTIENVIDGVVVTFVDITAAKEAEKKAKNALRFSESVINTVRECLVVVNKDIRVVSANRSFYRIFRANPEDTQGKLLYELGNRQWDIPPLRELLENVLVDQHEIEDFQVEHDFEGIGERKMLLNARRMEGEDDSERVIILSIEDVTDRGVS
jgi:two-component system, chemotaxis family, CheB/CheR fusion protein